MNRLIWMNEDARSLLHSFKYPAEILINIMVYLWFVIQSKLISSYLTIIKPPPSSGEEQHPVLPQIELSLHFLTVLEQRKNKLGEENQQAKYMTGRAEVQLDCW